MEMRDLVSDVSTNDHVQIKIDMVKLKYDKIPLLHCGEEENRRFSEDSTNEGDNKSSVIHRGGISWITAAIFIVADVAGGGVVTIPKAILSSGGLWGIVVTSIVCAIFAYTGILLGECWNDMYRRWPIYRNECCRKPYPEMAYRSLGGSKHARDFVSAIMYVMLFGVSIVYLLLSSKILNELALSGLNLRFGECKMLVVLAVLLWPLIMCKSPQDFSWAVIIAMCTTVFAVILIILGIQHDIPECKSAARLPPFQFDQFISSLGIFMFAYGGHSVFPTIQQDMINAKHFTRSTILGFVIVSVLYVPLALLAYITYGDSIGESIINSIQAQGIQRLANFFIACHCILTLTIVINPLSNELEHYLNVPHEFGVQRVLVRTALLLVIVFAALTFPSFGPILNLIGGSCVALTSAIFPSIFNLFLKANEDASRHETKTLIGLSRLVVQKTHPVKLFINIGIILLAIICGAITSKSALQELADSKFSVPCYFSSYTPSALTHVNCCGAFKNISSLDVDLCSIID